MLHAASSKSLHFELYIKEALVRRVIRKASRYL